MILSSAHARCPAGVCAGLFGLEQRQQRIGQDEGGDDQGYVKAIFDKRQALQIHAVVEVQVVVGPPGDQESADAQVHRPRPQPRTSRQPQERGKAKQQIREPKPEGGSLKDRQENEEGQLAARGFRAAWVGGPDDLPEPSSLARRIRP